MPHAIEPMPAYGPAIELQVTPDLLAASLAPGREDVAWRAAQFPFHAAQAPPRFEVRLTSRATTPLECGLAVRGRGRDWQPQWLRWVLVGEPEPGDHATREPGQLSHGELALPLAPGGSYRLQLECAALLDAATQTGDYDFDVVATTASGEIRQVPCVLRLAHPAATWLQYLPAIFGAFEDPNHPQPEHVLPFFSRFLRGFEDGLDPSRALLARIDEVFDPQSTPSDFLPWLATWVALTLDTTWPEVRRRQLISEAVELYRWRGTRYGLRRYLEIYTGFAPEIVDQPTRGLYLGRHNRLGRAALLGGLPAHTFTVTFIAAAALNEAVIRRIIETEKPAHTAYRLRFVHPGAENGRSLVEVLDVA